MKNHLKRITVPKTWNINRKENVFITRPKPGAHKLENGLPLSVILKDFLGLATTTHEVKKLLNNNEILVDGKRRKDHRYLVGLFDVLTITNLKKSYRVIFTKKGKITILEIDNKEANFKPCKILGKSLISKGKIQYNLHDGKNIISDVKAKVGDTLLLTLSKLEVKEVLPLQEGVIVFLIKGKNSGKAGHFKKIKNEQAIYTIAGKEIETAKNYLFVIGKDKSIIKLKND